jgi:hypothetical protein
MSYPLREPRHAAMTRAIVVSFPVIGRYEVKKIL